MKHKNHAERKSHLKWALQGQRISADVLPGDQKFVKLPVAYAQMASKAIPIIKGTLLSRRQRKNERGVTFLNHETKQATHRIIGRTKPINIIPANMWASVRAEREKK